MPRYFLHVRNSTGLAQDDEGHDVPDLEAARAKAIDGIRSLLAEEVRSGSLNLHGSIEISDEAGETIEIVSFGEAVELTPPEGKR